MINPWRVYTYTLYWIHHLANLTLSNILRLKIRQIIIVISILYTFSTRVYLVKIHRVPVRDALKSHIEIYTNGIIYYYPCEKGYFFKKKPLLKLMYNIYVYIKEMLVQKIRVDRLSNYNLRYPKRSYYHKSDYIIFYSYVNFDYS